MTATEAKRFATPTDLFNDFETMSLDEIYDRIKESATDKKFETSFYGIIPDHLKGLLETEGYQVRIYNFPPQQPMTAVIWD